MGQTRARWLRPCALANERRMAKFHLLRAGGTRRHDQKPSRRGATAGRRNRAKVASGSIQHGSSDGSGAIRRQQLLQSKSATALVRAQPAARSREVHQPTPCANRTSRKSKRSGARPAFYKERRILGIIPMIHSCETRAWCNRYTWEPADKKMSAESEIIERAQLAERSSRRQPERIALLAAKSGRPSLANRPPSRNARAVFHPMGPRSALVA